MTWNGRTLTVIYPVSEHHDIFNLTFPSIILLDMEVLSSHVYKQDIEKFWLWIYLLKLSHAWSINPSTDTSFFPAVWTEKPHCHWLLIPEFQRNIKEIRNLSKLFHVLNPLPKVAFGSIYNVYEKLYTQCIWTFKLH